MKIAVTYDNGQIFHHFAHTETFKVYEVAAGSQYTLFLLTEERFWGLMEPVNAQPLAGNVKVYNIGVMW